MILEASLPCPNCDTKNAVPSLPPFILPYLLFGKRCYSCKRKFSIWPWMPGHEKAQP